MLAMQYSFTLPADYDMAIIRRRISDNGQISGHSIADATQWWGRTEHGALQLHVQHRPGRGRA